MVYWKCLYIDSLFCSFILGLCHGTFSWHDYAPSNDGTISAWWIGKCPGVLALNEIMSLQMTGLRKRIDPRKPSVTVAGLWDSRPAEFRFDHTSAHMRLVIDKWQWDRFFFKSFRCPLSVSLHQRSIIFYPSIIKAVRIFSAIGSEVK